MSEDVARSLGANGAKTVTIAGRECTVRPLSVKELLEVERDCVERYKRAYIKTYADCSDLLPKGNNILLEKTEEAARWDVDDLPFKTSHDTVNLKINRNIRLWVADKFGVDKRTNVERMRRLCGAALDQGILDEKEYQRMADAPLAKVKIPYVAWWMTGSHEGMISFIWICFRHNGVSRDDVASELGKNPQMLAELSGEIESLSAAQVGPEQGPPPGRGKAGRAARR